MVCLLFHVRREALDVLDDTAAMNSLHLSELVLGALRRISAQVALAAFRAHQLARAGQAKTLGSRLVSLELEFAGFGFTRHCNLLLSDKIKTRAFNFLPRISTSVGLTLSLRP